MAARLRGALAVLVICASSLCPSCSGNSTFPSAASGPAALEETCAPPGSAVTLRCDVPSHRVTWYRLPADRAPEPLLVSSLSDPAVDYYRSGPRVSALRSPAARSVHLRLHNLTRRDAGLYVCSAEQGGRPRFGNVTRLRVREENCTGDTTTPVPDRETRGGLPALPVLLQWIVLVLLVIVSSALVGCALRHRAGLRRRRNKEPAVDEAAETPRDGEEEELQYATVKASRKSNVSRQDKFNVIYAQTHTGPSRSPQPAQSGQRRALLHHKTRQKIPHSRKNA